MTSMLIRAAGSRMSFICIGLPVPILLIEGGELREAAVVSNEDKAWVRSAWDGGKGDDDGNGDPGDIGDDGSDPFKDPETVSTQTFL